MLAVLVLTVEAMAAGWLVAQVLQLLKYEPGGREACPRPVCSHPSEGRLASAGAVVCHYLEGDGHPKSHRQGYIPRCFLFKFLR